MGCTETPRQNEGPEYLAGAVVEKVRGVSCLASVPRLHTKYKTIRGGPLTSATPVRLSRFSFSFLCGCSTTFRDGHIVCRRQVCLRMQKMSTPKTGKKKKSTRISHLSFFSFFYQKTSERPPFLFLSRSLSLSLSSSLEEGGGGGGGGFGRGGVLSLFIRVGRRPSTSGLVRLWLRCPETTLHTHVRPPAVTERGLRTRSILSSTSFFWTDACVRYKKEKEDSRGGGGFGEPPFFISLFVLARWGHPPDAGWKDMTSCKKKKKRG